MIFFVVVSIFLCVCAVLTQFLFSLGHDFWGFRGLRRFTLKANNTAALTKTSSRMSNFVNLTNFLKKKKNRSVYTTRVVG